MCIWPVGVAFCICQRYRLMTYVIINPPPPNFSKTSIFGFNTSIVTHSKLEPELTPNKTDLAKKGVNKAGFL